MLGRVDSIYGSIEAQKSAGSLHLHMQVFVQCLHQHTPLHTLLEKIRSTLPHLFNDYAKYKAHVCRQIYEDPDMWKARQQETEAAWKTQYEASTELIDTPEYLKHNKAKENSTASITKAAQKWLKSYLMHVQRRQEMRQNHVHVWNDKSKCKMPLTHCQKADNPMKCKAFFPRTKWLVEKTLVLCKAFLKKRDMPYTGKKKIVGSLHGPMNDESLNGCMAPLLAGCPGFNFNNDVQIPYRFPIIKELHDSTLCAESCWENTDETEMILAAQTQQNAQAGYAADYQCKRSAQSFNEVKEAKKGHHAMAGQIADMRLSYIEPAEPEPPPALFICKVG